jgi:hypothetical protein
MSDGYDDEVESARSRWVGRILVHRDGDTFGSWWGCIPHRVVDIQRRDGQLRAFIVEADRPADKPGHVGLDYLDQWKDLT